MLAIDLDGTLIRSDMLVECFAAAMSAAPLAALGALLGGGGRAGLKARLAALAAPDVATLPYEPAVLAEAERARAAGRRVVLVSAADAGLVAAVAAHLGLFDEAHGTTPGHNLKGPRKRDFLVERFGAGGFDYIGDARADLAVWQAAHTPITAGAGAGLRRAAEALSPEARHLAPAPGAAARALPYIRAMRPHQWLKNLLLLLPAIMAHRLDGAVLGPVLMAFVAFCLAASSVYLVNDLLDLAADRAHPRKRRRPFASGAAGLAPGAALALGLGLVAWGIALFLPLAFGLCLLAYGGLTLAYSLVLKRRLMIDIVTLAGLFTLRILAGGAAAAIAISPWMIGFSGFLFLALAAVKRQAELADAARRGLEAVAGRAWRSEDLPVATMVAVAAAHAAVLVLALYIASPDVQALYRRPMMLWAACPVLLYWLVRIVLIGQRGEMHDDPLVFAIRDGTSLFCACLLASIGLAAGPV
ncbi:UbiA family prenyltransferase [Paralimibaculum aggregatum]|uniref:UbiA family prenyltransferase n=1 Tax=Paralimibaculum aggregatum TaxID=3036245 RepID=A0ABQ6LMY3_9RHOB|nr:UbiA family prenyltransferase [Limibaculum sp. NKW23]GMG84357.1 UbiA family prenyltransferase [Limibaculum sp. NKW23]